MRNIINILNIFVTPVSSAGTSGKKREEVYCRRADNNERSRAVWKIRAEQDVIFFRIIIPRSREKKEIVTSGEFE